MRFGCVGQGVNVEMCREQPGEEAQFCPECVEVEKAPAAFLAAP
ncbi:MAG: hypothetical protein OXR66_01210 [Candidatus Woesearchaeota archaeon]|nr:hypothetical protein [Candidatus Woesearchaeota archaeon]